MKSTQSCLVIIAAIFLLASCSSFETPLSKLKPLSEGELRLTGIEMPEYVREDLVYQVILTTDTEKTPQISKVCFRWLTEEISSVSPSLYCYAMNGDFGTGNPCYSRTAVATPGSEPFCAEGSDIRTDIPGKLIVKIQPTGLRANFNRLQGQAEYIYDGQPRVTNSVKTSVTVDKLGD
jgi:hypothetical protein